MVSRLDCWVSKLMKMIKMLKCQFKEIRSLDQICIVGFSSQLTHEKSDIYKMLRERCKQNWIMCHFGGRDRPVCALPYRICLLPFPIEKSFTTFIFIWKWKWEKDKSEGESECKKKGKWEKCQGQEHWAGNAGLWREYIIGDRSSITFLPLRGHFVIEAASDEDQDDAGKGFGPCWLLAKLQSDVKLFLQLIQIFMILGSQVHVGPK